MKQTLKASVKKSKITVGGKLKIAYKAPGKKYTFTSSDKKIATVNKKGIITGKHAGTVKITVKAAATKNYTASKKILKITILRRNLTKNKYKITIPKDSYTYSGKKIRPVVTVKGSEGTLKKGRDYKVSYAKNINAGTAAIKVTGIKDYKGTIQKTFTIAKAKQTIRATLSDALIRVGGSSRITVSKKAGKLSYRSSDSGIAEVKKGIVTGKSPGKAIITVKASAGENYQAVKTSVVVTVRKSSLKEAKLKVEISPRYPEYTGEPIYPKITVRDQKRKLAEGTDYVLSYKYNTEIGTAVLTISGYGSYYGTIEKNFFIIPQKTTFRSLTSEKAGAVSLSWNTKDHITGYQIQYATDKDFKTGKLVRVKESQRSSGVISRLQAGQTYYFRIRTYKYIPEDDTFVSDWSEVSAVKISR